MGGKGKVKRQKASHIEPEAEPGVQLTGTFFTGQLEMLLFALTISSTQIIYYLTMYPSMAGGDSGELMTVAVEFGVAHPPGYPLFTMLGWVWNKIIPVGTPVYKLNLLSVIFSGASHGLVYLIVHQVTYNHPAAVLTAFWCAFSRIFWVWSLQFEVFSLNNLLTCGIMLAMVRFSKEMAALSSARKHNWEHTGIIRAAKVCAVVCGLAMSNQHTCVLIIIPLALWVLATLLQCGVTDIRTLALIALHGFAGLLLYLQIPLSALVATARHTFGDQSTVISSLLGLKGHVFREHYGMFKLSPKDIKPDVLFNLGCWITQCRVQFTAGLCITAGLTILLSYKLKRRGVVLVLSAMMAVYMGVFCSLANLPKYRGIEHGVLERFWMTPNLLLLCISGIGMGEVFNKIEQRFGSRWQLFGIPVITLLVSWQIQCNFSLMNQSQNYVHRNYASHIFQHAPNNSLVLALGDSHINTLWYHIYGEDARTDLCPVAPVWLGYATTTWYYKDLLPKLCPGVMARQRQPGEAVFNYKMFLDDNFDRRPILICGDVPSGLIESIAGHYDLWPWGLCIRIVRLSDNQDFHHFFVNEMPLTDLITTPLPSQQHYTQELYMWEKVMIDYMMTMLTKPGEMLHYRATIEHDPIKQRVMLQTEIEYWQGYVGTMYSESAGENAGNGDMRLKLHSNLGQACYALATLTKDKHSNELEKCAREHWQMFLDHAPKGGDEHNTFVYAPDGVLLKKVEKILSLPDFSKLTFN